MKRIAGVILAIGVFSQLGTAHAVGVVFNGNTDGNKAFAELQKNNPDLWDSLKDLPTTLQGGQGGLYLDLDPNCLPEWLVIKGGPRYVVLSYDEIEGIADKNDTWRVWVSKTALLNPGGQPPEVSHWVGLGKRSVPEPSSILAGLLALGMGLLGWNRMRRIA